MRYPRQIPQPVTIEHFDFDGLDESAIGYDPDYGPLIHKSKFYAWIGYGTTNNTRTTSRHLGEKDLVKGAFIPIGQVNRGGRKADALTIRGVHRILLRSDHPRALEYADRVLDMLDDIATTGIAVDPSITNEQIEAGKERLEGIALRRLEEHMDFKPLLHSLKLGGAVSDEYRMVQNTLYIRTFGMTAARIRDTRPQLIGDRLKDGSGFTKASAGVAKNYLTEHELLQLNSVVLATFAQIQAHYPTGTTVEQMINAINRAADLIQPKAFTA